MKKKRRDVPATSFLQRTLMSTRCEPQRDARDIGIIHRNADQRNADAEDGLEDQAPEDLDDENELNL